MVKSNVFYSVSEACVYWPRRSGLSVCGFGELDTLLLGCDEACDPGRGASSRDGAGDGLSWTHSWHTHRDTQSHGLDLYSSSNRPVTLTNNPINLLIKRVPFWSSPDFSKWNSWFDFEVWFHIVCMCQWISVYLYKSVSVRAILAEPPSVHLAL